MIILPVKNLKGRDVLIVVLNPDNVARMQEADPVQIENCGKVLVNPKVMICFEKDSPEFVRLLNEGNLEKILDFLSRGFRFRPEMGDHDRGPESLGSMQ